MLLQNPPWEPGLWQAAVVIGMVAALLEQLACLLLEYLDYILIAFELRIIFKAKLR